MPGWLFLALLVGCADDAPPPVPPPEPPAEKAPPPAPALDLPSPEKLYAMCEERVEQPQADGECTSDDDCTRSGCSGEVCTTVAGAEGMNTTCEGKLCFQVLDTCGCVEGQCRWSLLDALPPNAIPAPTDDGDAPQGKLPSGDKRKRR